MPLLFSQFIWNFRMLFCGVGDLAQKSTIRVSYHMRFASHSTALHILMNFASFNISSLLSLAIFDQNQSQPNCCLKLQESVTLPLHNPFSLGKWWTYLFRWHLCMYYNFPITWNVADLMWIMVKTSPAVKPKLYLDRLVCVQDPIQCKLLKRNSTPRQWNWVDMLNL